MGCCLSILSLLRPVEAEELPEEEQYHNFKDIVKDADDKSDLLQRVRSGGIYLDNKRMKYWVDESGSNCFMFFARSLSITWDADEQYWNWIPSNESGEEDVEVACLKDVCWLEVQRGFDLSLLSPNVNYEVVFILTMKDFSHGWHNIVTLVLQRPDNTRHEQKLNLNPEKLKGHWEEVRVGEFNSGNSTGSVRFALFDTESEQWKGGLVIKGVVVRPVRTGSA
ncbi:Protein PHLOEM PROTEIN 2-LIKE A1 [Acorus gramineus]|uniref:Protein PHLOEM PROTEIN 2-LIKE A1 n=1 Tax=Acorus gramineus TaxID=55184 RepID=A0AAV9B796_ACOGR|nr:Protein PHLOEM PROTEIN 2-LIKE A1 [Acorus gramineus]